MDRWNLVTKLVAKVTSRTPVSVEEDDEGDPAGDSRQSLSVAFCLSAVCRQSQLPTVRTGRRGVPARGGQNAADVKGPEGAVMGPPLLTGRATSYSPLPLPHSLLATLAWFSSGMHPLFSASGPQNTPFFLPGLVLLSLYLADTFLTFRVSGERSKAAHVPQSRSLILLSTSSLFFSSLRPIYLSWHFYQFAITYLFVWLAIS